MIQFAKNFLINLCCVYTIVSVSGALVNMIAGTQTNNFNVLFMFATCAIATFVLSLHKCFESLSPLVMILLQYLIACVLCGALILALHVFYEPTSWQGVFEFYRSFTIPYVILAGFYYYSVFKETKEQNALIRELQERTATSEQE